MWVVKVVAIACLCVVLEIPKGSLGKVIDENKEQLQSKAQSQVVAELKDEDAVARQKRYLPRFTCQGRSWGRSIFRRPDECGCEPDRLCPCLPDGYPQCCNNKCCCSGRCKLNADNNTGTCENRRSGDYDDYKK